MTSDFTKISYYDLKLENQSNRLPLAVGFENEIERLNRILCRQIQHNAVISAASGCGKTALLFAWAKVAGTHPLFAQKKIVFLDSSTLQKVGQLTQASLSSYMEAFDSLENSLVILDSFGEMIYQSPQALQNWNTLLKPLFFKARVSIILSMQPEELAWLKENKSHFLSHFETINLEPLPDTFQMEILKQAATKFSQNPLIETGALELILKLCKRFPSLGKLPKSAIRLLDEAVSAILARGLPSVAEGNPLLSKALVEKIAAEKTGVPVSRLSDDGKALLKNLPMTLKSKIVGQEGALGKMVPLIQRARLGLRSQTRPLGSFLVLGPSGVGKTETAKILASELYGSPSNFLRIDMSEFGESHSAARLLGSPAGYVGYEAGGQLTNHFQNYPHSLLLLDEIEKANPKIFDIFLQILDDGRITAASGEAVDLTQSIIMATSNLAVQEILDGYAAGQNIHDENFLKEFIFPKLLQQFRMEFLNRFDAIVIYKPLSVDELVNVALLEVAKIEERMKEHNIKFNISRELLGQRLAGLTDPRFGARPVKRFIEETCENLITEKLLN